MLLISNSRPSPSARGRRARVVQCLAANLARRRPELRGLALLLFLVLLGPPAAAAQEVSTCQTANGPRSIAEITTELRQAGYNGPFDDAAQAAAYARATGGPVTCPPPAAPGRAPLVVLLVGGYGSDLASTSTAFAALQAALLERDPRVKFLLFSYTGSHVQGCGSQPTPYTVTTTAQPLSTSKQVLIDTVAALQTTCPDQIAVVGHSLGGLITLQALGEQPTSRVRDVLTAHSPLGGAPAGASGLCIEAGFCPGGPVTGELAELYANGPRTSAVNTALVARLEAARTRVSAWGNESDCLYNVGLCSSLAGQLLPGVDATSTQWLGVPRAVHRNYVFAQRLWNIPASHVAVLTNAAEDIARELLP